LPNCVLYFYHLGQSKLPNLSINSDSTSDNSAIVSTPVFHLLEPEYYNDSTLTISSTSSSTSVSTNSTSLTVVDDNNNNRSTSNQPQVNNFNDIRKTFESNSSNPPPSNLQIPNQPDVSPKACDRSPKPSPPPVSIRSANLHNLNKSKWPPAPKSPKSPRSNKPIQSIFSSNAPRSGGIVKHHPIQITRTKSHQHRPPIPRKPSFLSKKRPESAVPILCDDDSNSITTVTETDSPLPLVEKRESPNNDEQISHKKVNSSPAGKISSICLSLSSFSIFLCVPYLSSFASFFLFVSCFFSFSFVSLCRFHFLEPLNTFGPSQPPKLGVTVLECESVCVSGVVVSAKSECLRNISWFASILQCHKLKVVSNCKICSRLKHHP